MSSDWWLNNIGAAATVTTPTGSIPQYGLAYDLGTAAWPDARSFNNFVGDTVKRARSQDIAKIEAAKAQNDQGWFQKALSGAGGILTTALGALHRDIGGALGSDPYEMYAKHNSNPMPRGQFDKLDRETQNALTGGKAMSDIGQAPGVKQFAEGFNAVSNVLETPLIMDRNAGMQRNMGLWLDKSAWGRAWQEADDRTIGQAVIEDIMGAMGSLPDTPADLDRMRRTNSLYGIASFATDLYVGAKLDPTVLTAKTVRELGGVATGKLPEETSALKPEALRVARGQAPAKTINPLTKYASYRGKRVATNFADLREYAKTHTLTDMTGLPMFKRQAVNGPQAALAFKLAAGDDKLWDLTQRAVLADPVAWQEIGRLKHAVPDELKAYAPGDTRTYLDAIDATKTKMKQLEDEVNDLEKNIAKRADGPQALYADRPDGGINPGFFEHHTWELHRDLASKQADIDEIARKLEGHEDYSAWLSKMPHVYGDNDWYAGPVTSIDKVSVKGAPMDSLSQHTYQKSQYGATHQINQIAKSAWIMKANPIDLNRVDSGVTSIRRQFDQFDHLFGYKDYEGLDAAVTRFVKAPDQFERFKIAKEIEDTHLVGAISHKFGLAPETVDLFLGQTRLRKNDMMNALLSGEGAVYSTGSAMDKATILSRSKGMAEIEVMDNGKRVTMRVPEEALQPQTLPVDPTQTPNMYMPMDTREVYLAVKRNNELFEALDQDVRNFGAKHTGKVMEGINSMGSTFNSLWKPVQLFRLAWPQRVIMDEGLRALAVIGVNTWGRNFGAAARDAALNAVNPFQHGILPALERRKVKMGPGPLTDEIAGRKLDVPGHEALIEESPFVPSYYSPQLSPERADRLNQVVAYNEQVRAQMTRYDALMRNPNAMQSLAEDAPRGADWLKIKGSLKSDPIPDTPYTMADLAKADPDSTIPELRKDLGGFADGQELRSALADPDLPYAMAMQADGSTGNFAVRASNQLMEKYGIGGSRRKYLDMAIENGRKKFDAELAHRKTGAGHGPLFSQVHPRAYDREAQREMLLAQELGAEWFPITATGARIGNYGAATRLSETIQRGDYQGPHVDQLRDFVLNDSGTPQTLTFDAITGKKVKSGYAVPVKEVPFTGHASELHDFIAQNKELLASNGYRIQMDTNAVGEFGTLDEAPRYSLRLVRLFRTNEIRKATDFADHTGAEHFVNVGDNHKRYIRDWEDKSPIAEALDRQFTAEPEVKLEPGKAPIVGKPAVYHGTTTGLPEDLAPRTEVPVARGNFAGQGFYTTVSKDLAESYNRGGLYTIRGSKSGKVYKTFNLEDQMAAADKGELQDYMLEYYREKGLYGNAFANDPDVEFAMNEINASDNWMNLMATLENWWVGGDRTILQPQQLLTKFLEEKRNAGALMYDGGRLTGGERHQVYVWLSPEDLEVKPAYAKTGRYRLLEEWFQHPDSVENMVPENRIMRTGMKPAARARYEEAQKARTDMSPANAEMRNFDDIEFDINLDSKHSAFIRRMKKKREFGRGTSTWKTNDGTRVVAQNAFEGPGEVYTPLISSNPVYTRLTDTYKRTLSKYRERAAGYKSTPPPDISPEAMKTTTGRQAAIEYYTAWSDLLNEQIRNSPIWYRMLEGQSDDQIVHWLTTTDEGARLRRELPHMGHRPEKWVEEHRQRLDSYLPDKNLQAIAKDRQIQPSELRRVPAEMMPTIYEPDLQMLSGRGEAGKFLKDQVDRIYHALGTVPSDLLVRQPFFKSLYDLKMRNLIAAADSDQLTNGVLRGYEKLAREFALRQVKKNLYDLADETNFTQAVRFLSPFWGAQQEAMTKWLNIAIEKPETVAKFYVGVNAAYNNFTVINEDGKPTDGPHNLFNYNANDRVILQIPKNLAKVPMFGKMIKEFGSIGVAFGAANTALQGDNPLIPSLGPIVTMPADKLVNTMWDTHGTQFDDNFFYRWLFPVGRPADGVQGTLEQLFPGWGRRMSALAQGQDSRSYANTYWSVYREMDLDHRKRGLPPPTPEEVDSATKWHFGLRVIGAFALPAAMEFRPKNQLFLDEYHKMQELYGPDAFEKFVQKRGADAARYAASSSNSPVGVPPTAQGMEDWTQNKQLIRKFPEWGGAIVSPDAWADDFSSDAYGAQFDIKLGPGTQKTIRETNDPEERSSQTDVRLGWLQYQQFMSNVNAELYRRGLTSLDQNDAADLKEMKSEYVAQMQRDLPAWAEDFHTFSDTVYSRVGGLQSFAFDQQFDNRPDMQGVRQYLTIRDMAAQSLDAYGAEGGSRSLQAQENTDLRNWFYTQVGSLIQQNPAFGEFYTRYLESDRLERGSGP